MANMIEPGQVTAVSFDGSGNTKLVKTGLNFGSHTIQGWFRVDTNGRLTGLVATPGVTGSNVWMTQAITVPAGAGYQIQVEVGRAPNPNGIDPALKIHRLRTVLATGQWVHLSYVADTASNTLAIYLNGVRQPADVVNGKDGNFSEMAISNTTLTVGKDRENNIALIGQADEVRIWNRALTSAEITANWNRAVVAGENGLLAGWPFNNPPVLLAPEGNLIQPATSTSLALSSTLATRGVATDGRFIYVNDSGVSIDKYTMDGVFVSSSAVANLPVNSNQMTWCAGFLFVRNFGVLYRVSTTDWSSVPVSVPADKPLLPGRSWMVGDLFGMPDGRLGLCGAKDASGRATVRFYGVSADGRTLSWSEDRAVIDPTPFPNDFHGAASDGTHLYLIEYTTQACKSYSLATGAVVYDGSGVNLRTPGRGAPLVNLTYLTRDPLTGAFIAGDYDSRRLLCSAASACIVVLGGAVEDTAFPISYGMLAAAARVVDDGPAQAVSFRIESVAAGLLTRNGVPAVPGTLVSAADVLVWTPPANANGKMTAFSVKAWDGQLASRQTAQVVVQVAPVNDGPALTGAQATLAAGREDEACTIQAADLLRGFTDVEGDTLRVADLRATNGTLVARSDGGWTFTPVANFNGTVELSYNVVDGAGGSTAARQRFTLESVNDVPVLRSAQAGLVAGVENTPYTLRQADLLVGWNDTDGDALRVLGLRASVGQVIEAGNGTWTFVPPANFSGEVVLSYQVGDGQGGQVATTQRFQVTALNDAVYATRIQWGGDQAPWHDNGKFVLGNANALPIAMDIGSPDNGQTLGGMVITTMGFRAVRQGNPGTYVAEIQWGGPQAPWRPAGLFVFGGAPLNWLKVNSGDGGRSLGGILCSIGSGGVGFRGALVDGTSPAAVDACYTTQIQWGGDSAPWHDNGVLVLGRGNALPLAMDLHTTDNGQTLVGSITAPVRWRAVWQGPAAGTYATEIQCGGAQAPWYPAGVVAFGGPGCMPLNYLRINSGDGGRNLGGVLCSIGSGGVGFQATRVTG